MHSFLGVTCHTFESGEPNSHLLAFRAFSGSHTGQHIAESLEAIIEQNELQTKIRSVVTDNAANMRKAMSVMLEANDASVVVDEDVDEPELWEEENGNPDLSSLTDCEHLPCFAHSLQLVVHDGLSALGVARPLLAKCCKLASLLHQSALFRSEYETVMGTGKLIPSSNDTRWNITYRQLQAVANLDQAKLTTLLSSQGHMNLNLTTKDMGQLQEIVRVLEPFCEATDLTQGDKVVTISCVIPVILSLNKHLESRSSSGSSVVAFPKALLHSLKSRFAKLFDLIGIPCGTAGTNALQFNSHLFLQAAALDPRFGFNWLEDHSGTDGEKQALRFRVNGLHIQLFIYYSP